MAELIIEERSSKGIVSDYFSRIGDVSKDYKEPPNAYRVLMDMYENDPVLFAAVDLTTDMVTYNGYDFLGKNKQAKERARKLFNTTLDFDEAIKNVLKQLIINGDAYLEIRWNESHTEVKELHPLNTDNMKINYDEHGETLGYVQTVEGKGKKDNVPFTTDEVIHFRSQWVGNEVYSKAPFQSIARSYSTKVYATNYLQSIFVNLPPKISYFLKGASKNERELFVENLIRAKNNPSIDILGVGEAFEAKVIGPTFDENLLKFLQYLRKEILMITRVPPHWIGILDGMNRGIGENVVIPFEAKIKSLQHEIDSKVNRELMPKLKLPNTEFKWNSISLVDKKTVMEIASQMKAINLDSETIIQFLRENRFNLRDDAKIEDPEPVMGGPQIQDDSAPSRQRMNKASDTMNSGVDAKGVSDAGKKKLDAKKVV